MEDKPKHVRPALYAFIYEDLKGIAKKYGYNLVLHGSMNRDLDLIAIPWVDNIGDIDQMIKEFAVRTGGHTMPMSEDQKFCFPHGRMSYVINLNRGGKFEQTDPQFYLDISVIPARLKMDMSELGELINLYYKEKISISKFLESINQYFNGKQYGR